MLFQQDDSKFPKLPAEAKSVRDGLIILKYGMIELHRILGTAENEIDLIADAFDTACASTHIPNYTVRAVSDPIKHVYASLNDQDGHLRQLMWPRTQCSAWLRKHVKFEELGDDVTYMPLALMLYAVIEDRSVSVSPIEMMLALKLKHGIKRRDKDKTVCTAHLGMLIVENRYSGIQITSEAIQEES